jgi:glycosyltransferase involved in cell wall biosynthesis
MKRQIRVLMIVRQFFPWIGGTERQAQKLAAKLIELGIEVKVVTGWWRWDTPRHEIIDGIPVFRNFTCWSMFGLKGLRKFGGYLYLLSLFWYLWKNRATYDVIHIHKLSYPAFPAVLTGRLLSKKTMIKIANSGQNSDIRQMEANHLLPGQKQMLPVSLGSDRLVAVNKGIIVELGEAGVSLQRIELIPNGVELTLPAAQRDYKLDGTVTVIFVGRLVLQKGLDILLPAFQQVVSSQPHLQWRLWLLGDGVMRAELETLAQQLGVAEQVKFWGPVNGVSDYLAQADIFVLPSRAEGMSNALLEAMGHGLPCIATRIDGNLDLIQHGLNGLLVTPDDTLELAEALINLVGNEALRQKVGKSAYQTIETEYSVDRVAQRYISLYETLLSDLAQPLAINGTHR